MKLLGAKRYCLVFLVAFLCCNGAALAATGQWTSLGPWGGDVECLVAVSPSLLYAGTQNGGVYKSSDGGAHWSAINNGLGNPMVYALAVDPVAPATIYAGTNGNGIYKSVDSGGSWSPLAAAPAIIYSLTVDPVDHNTVYAGTDGAGAYKSTNGGTTWAAANTGMATATVYAVAVDPRLSTSVYAATYTGIFRSTDGGANWSLTGNTGWTRDLVVSAATPATIYAGTSTGVFRSSDGVTWTQAGLPVSKVNTLVIDPANSARVFAGTTAGVFGTTDSGGSWTSLAGGLTNGNIQTIVIDPTDLTYSTLFAGTWGGGVFKSANSGNTWQSSNTGLGNTFGQALISDPAAPATIYAAMNDGLYKSSDGGTTWAVSTSGLTNVDVEALVLNPAAPGQLFAGTWGSGVFKSSDGGATWQAANSGISSAMVHSLAMDGSNAAILYAGTYNGIFKTTDGGVSWGGAGTGFPVGTEVWSMLTAADSFVYAGTGSGFYRSSDGGVSWTQSNTGLAPCGVVFGLAADPALANTLYAATCGGVYKSGDGGTTWSLANSGITATNIYNLTVANTAPVILYAGSDSGVFVSTDRGGAWSALNNGSTNNDVYGFAVAGTLPATLYAGTWGGGVFSLTSNGDISVSPAALDLGYRVAAQNSATKVFTIANAGASNLVVSSVAVTGAAAAFSVAPGTCSSLTPTIASGGSCTINVTFTPPTGGPYSANVEVASNSASSPVTTVAVNGVGVYPLAVYVGGTGGGAISVSAPTPVDAGLVCSAFPVFCGAFERGTAVALAPSADNTSLFSGWSGCPVTMGQSCFITLNSALNVTGNFTRQTSLQAIINGAAPNDTIRLPAITYSENIVMDRSGTSLTLSGGWNDYSFVSQTGFTSVQGSLTIANGTLILENIQLI